MYCLVSASAQPLAVVPKGTPQPPVNCGSAVTLNPPPNLVESELRAASLLRPNCCSSPATSQADDPKQPRLQPNIPSSEKSPHRQLFDFLGRKGAAAAFCLFFLLISSICCCFLSPLIFGLDAIAASHPLGSFPLSPGVLLFCAFERGLDTPPSEDAN